MDVYDTVYAILDANGGEVSGRTAIQKLVYLCSRKISDLDVPPYMAHYYGPFSPGLGWALEKMVSCSFVYEAKIHQTVYEGYKYGLAPDGRTIAENAKTENKGTFEKIAGIVGICKDICELKTHPLSYASKIHYICSQQTEDKMSFQDAIKYAKKLGWKVSEDNVDQGARLLEQLKLDSVSR